jgi:hypothetical protein
METVLSYSTKIGQFNVAERNDEIRFITCVNGVSRVLIARFTQSELKKLLINSYIDNSQTKELQHAYIVTKTVLDSKNLQLILHHYQGETIIPFKENQWENLIKKLVDL